MKKTIKGTISYEIEFDTENHNVEIDYTTSMHNDMAALAIVQMILSSAEEHQAAIHNSITGRDKNSVLDKKNLKTMLNYIRKGRSGAAKVLTMLMDNFEDYEKYEAANTDKEATIKEWIKENNVEIGESGKLSEEQAKELLEKRKNDLMQAIANEGKPFPPTTEEEIKPLNDGKPFETFNSSL